MKRNYAITLFAILLNIFVFNSCKKEDEVFINSAPTIKDQEFYINENSPNETLVNTVVAIDKDQDQVLKYFIISGNIDNAFKIDSITGKIYVNNSKALDFEKYCVFELGVKVVDNFKDKLSSCAKITIQVYDLYENNKPHICNQNFTIDENKPNGTFVGNVVATDADQNQTLTYSIFSGNFGNTFIINQSSGCITVNNNSALDFETRQSITFQVIVKDNYSLSLSDTALITINISNVFELTDKLVAYYPFNSNTNDESGNLLFATNYGATLTNDRFGTPNKAYRFDGINQYIDFPNNPLLKPQFPFTIACWIKLDQNSPSNQILTTDFKLDNYTGVWLNISINGNVIINYGNDTPISLYARKSKMGNSLLNLNQWYHITGVFTSSSQMDIYINGINDGGTYSGYASNLVYSNNPGSIGRKDCGNDTQPPYYFKGSVDDVVFYNKALNQSEIKSLTSLK